jgi:hypothetical protein
VLLDMRLAGKLDDIVEVAGALTARIRRNGALLMKYQENVADLDDVCDSWW